MTRSSVREYVEALRARYRRASRKEKGRMLDEFTQVTGYHRKAAIRLLGRCSRGPGRRRGCRRQYGPEVAAALGVVWEASDRLCSHRLHPFCRSWYRSWNGTATLPCPLPSGANCCGNDNTFY